MEGANTPPVENGICHKLSLSPRKLDKDPTASVLDFAFRWLRLVSISHDLELGTLAEAIVTVPMFHTEAGYGYQMNSALQTNSGHSRFCRWRNCGCGTTRGYIIRTMHVHSSLYSQAAANTPHRMSGSSPQ